MVGELETATAEARRAGEDPGFSLAAGATATLALRGPARLASPPASAGERPAP